MFRKSDYLLYQICLGWHANNLLPLTKPIYWLLKLIYPRAKMTLRTNKRLTILYQKLDVDISLQRVIWPNWHFSLQVKSPLVTKYHLSLVAAFEYFVKDLTFLPCHFIVNVNSGSKIAFPSSRFYIPSSFSFETAKQCLTRFF